MQISFRPLVAVVLGAAMLCGCLQDPFTIVTLPDHDGGLPADVSVSDADAAPSDVGNDGDGFVFPDSGDGCVVQVELCNNVDDDCDGQIDEDYDKLNSPLYCDGCKGCQFLFNFNAVPDCVSGACVIQSCAGGFIDFNGDVSDGCELECTPTGPEICDGKDNDCDGMIDEGVTAPAPCKQLGECAGATATCEGEQGWVCQYGSSVEIRPCTSNADCGGAVKCTGGFCPGVLVFDEARCDGLDGDCDGVADDPWVTPVVGQAIGEVCSPDPPSVMGICRAMGVVVCNAAMDGIECQTTQPGLPATDEACNGLDDDCDGLVDEETADAAGKGVEDSMIHVMRNVGGTNYDYYIYAYEASRPDADASDPGISSARACAKPNALPWANLTYDQAQAACAAAGKRLCTGQEWFIACSGPSETTYPYGVNYVGANCNGIDQAAGAALATGALASCEGGDTGLFDMSGNVREWTNDLRGTTPAGKPIYVVRGGAYHTPGPGLTCAFELSQAVADVVLPTIGFRCCSDSPP